MSLKSLDEHNEQRRRALLYDPDAQQPNGIACPECGKELLDIQRWLTLASNPPQKRTGCQHCGYTGYRIA